MPLHTVAAAAADHFGTAVALLAAATAAAVEVVALRFVAGALLAVAAAAVDLEVEADDLHHNSLFLLSIHRQRC
jgi:hypothetical protein